MAIWPSAVATDADLYVAKNALQTTLATALGTGDVTIVLASATGFPVAGAVVIGNEVCFYTNISGSSLTGVTRGADGTTAAAHSVGVPVGAAVVAFHHNVLKDEIKAIEGWLNTKFGNGASAYTVSRALQTNSSTGIPEVSSVTNTELGYLSGVTSAIQTQFGTKAADSLVVHLAGTETITGTKTFTAEAFFKSPSSGTNNVWGIKDSAAGDVWQFEYRDSDGRLRFVPAGSYPLDFGTTAAATFHGQIAMSSNKITGVAAATASGEALMYGQTAPGIIKQVVSTLAFTGNTITSASYTDVTGASATITPSSATSKILVMMTFTMGTSTTHQCSYTVLRDSTNLGDATEGWNRVVLAANLPILQTIVFWDSPATTSATTYKLRAVSDGTNSTYAGNFAGSKGNNIYLFEIGQ